MSYTILIADDQSVNREIIKRVLKNSLNDLTFLDAVDGQFAMQILGEKEVDLIILDLMMPQKDGFEVLADMKADERYKEIPVIIYSAMESIESINTALEHGAYDYFTKPLTKEQIRVIIPLKVRNALRSYEQHKALRNLNERMKMELMLARVFQNNLMHEGQSFPAADMFGKYWPSDEISGDFYDCVWEDESLWFIIADVSGHGVAAAMISSMVKVEFGHWIRQASSPAEVLMRMNATFCRITQGNYFITAFIGRIRGNTCLYSNAGHPYPVLFCPDANRTEYLRMNGYALGMFEKADYAEQEFEINGGDLIFAYTDGLLESKFDNDEANHYNELGAYLRNYRELAGVNPAGLLQAVLKLFYDRNNYKVRDDVAAMIIKCK